MIEVSFTYDDEPLVRHYAVVPENAQYPSGEPFFKIPNLDPHRTVDRLSILLRWNGNIGDFVATLSFLTVAGWAQRALTSLYIPFFPGARQDKIAGGDLSHALIFYSHVLHHLDLVRTLYVFDPHSHEFHRLLGSSPPPATATQLITFGMNHYDTLTHHSWDCVIAPDSGARSRAMNVAQQLEVPWTTAKKERDPQTGQLVSYSLESDYIIKQTVVRPLVVDDICDGGGTFNMLADVLQEINPAISPDLWVTHGLFTKGTEHLLKRYGRIYTTDSTTAAVYAGLVDKRVTVVRAADHLFKTGGLDV